VPNYLHQASGVLSGGFPWSINMVSTSSGSESAAETVWANGVVAMWNHASLNALIPANTSLTLTSTSTANALFKQTTKTTTTHALVGTATQGLPYQVGEVITWRTAQATKWGRGRWYFPGLAPTALATDGYLLSAAAVTAIVDGVNAGLTVWVASLNFQIVHRKDTLSGPLADTLTPISGGDVSNKFVIQRRRADKLVPTRTALTF